jgi:transcriptional regulator with XRE-family HTH domain
MSSIGARLHLLRLSMHWSVEECAYRITIAANHYTTPETWQSWERGSDDEAAENGLMANLATISELFAADVAWLTRGDPTDEPLSSSSVVAMKTRPKKIAD